MCGRSRTCFFVLGLISSTPQGAEILDDYHWEATLSPLGLPTGLCVPVDIDRFVSVSVVRVLSRRCTESAADTTLGLRGERGIRRQPSRAARDRGRAGGDGRHLPARQHRHRQRRVADPDQVRTVCPSLVVELSSQYALQDEEQARVPARVRLGADAVPRAAHALDAEVPAAGAAVRAGPVQRRARRRGRAAARGECRCAPRPARRAGAREREGGRWQ